MNVFIMYKMRTIHDNDRNTTCKKAKHTPKKKQNNVSNKKRQLRIVHLVVQPMDGNVGPHLGLVDSPLQVFSLFFKGCSLSVKELHHLRIQSSVIGL